MRVALFITCVNDMMFPGTGQAVVEVLERLGHTVDFPREQSCCGQMHTNSGYADLARPLADAFADAFVGYDYVVSPSGSCAAAVRHQHPRLTDKRVPPVLELSEFLVDVLGVLGAGVNSSGDRNVSFESKIAGQA